MIACILAGGEGTRLRPISCRRPKPLTPLLTRPVLGHTLAHLRACGIERAFVTLRHMSGMIRDFFGDGREWGVEISWHEEEEPLGTAGGAAACGLPEDEEILIVSGDAVCDFDYAAALALHRKRGAKATLLLSRADAPLEYGAVECDAGGRVTAFAEKPAWNDVRTDAVNTGIYILSPGVLRKLPKGRPADFSRDVFPAMLARGEALYGDAPQGYWRDIGDCGAYLACVHDALEGRIGLALPAFPGGVCAFSEIPEDVQICPPVYIGQNVLLGENARIGPCTVLEDGARIGSGSVIEGSVIGGTVGENASVHNAVTGRGSRVGDGAALSEGTVLGDGARVGARTQVLSGVRIWPDCDTGEDAVVRFSVHGQGGRTALRFTPDGILEAEADVLDAQACASFGGALSAVCFDAAGLSCDGSAAGKALLSAVSGGLRAAGADAALLGASFAAQAAFGTAYAGLRLGAHIEACGAKVRIHVFAGDGLPPDGAVLRKLEHALGSGDYRRAAPQEMGKEKGTDGTRDAYLRACLPFGHLRGRAFGAGPGESGACLQDILLLTGGRARRDALPCFLPSPDGLALEARDENGVLLDDAHTLACAFYAAYADAGQTRAVCPDGAPNALDALARDLGLTLVRPAQSAAARDELAKRPYFRDGVRRAAFLAAYLARTGGTLADLRARIPDFAFCERTLSLRSGRAAFMRAAQAGGIRTGSAAVRYAPETGAERLRVYAEAASAEAAQELCALVCEQARRLDSDLKRQKARRG